MTRTGIHRFITANKVDLLPLSGYLDNLDSSTRISEVRSLDAAEQASLFAATQGFRPIDLSHFVPTGTTPFTEVIHYGRNSLPFLRIFEKRFCITGAEIAHVCGYNEQPIKFLTGPGYFMLWQATEFEVAIDYTQLPLEKPQSWPPVLPNSARLGRWIYDATLDIVRGISEHVVIGRATRAGVPLDNWFVLCRA
jgi:hypothetical protein